MAATKPWWEVVYSTIAGGGRSAYVTGHGIEVVQAASSAAALAQVQAEHHGAEGTVNGPYPTRAAAQAQAKADTAAQAAGTETGSGGTGTSSNPKTNINIDPLAGIAGSLEAFFGALTDGKMWRSIGWILLGILLMLLGVALWIGPSAARRSPIGLAAGQLG